MTCLCFGIFLYTCYCDIVLKESDLYIIGKNEMILFSISFTMISSALAFSPLSTDAVGPDGLVCMIITSTQLQTITGRDAAIFFKIHQMIPRGIIFIIIIVLALKLCARACKTCCRTSCKKMDNSQQNNSLVVNNFEKLIFHLVVFVAFWSPWQIYTLSSYHYGINDGYFQGISLVILNAKGIGNLFAVLLDPEIRAYCTCLKKCKNKNGEHYRQAI